MNSKMFILHDSEGNEIGRFVSNKTKEELLEELNKMGKTQKHQDENKDIPQENKYNRLRKLAWDMYSKMKSLSTDLRPLRKSMKEFHKFIIYEEKEL